MKEDCLDGAWGGISGWSVNTEVEDGVRMEWEDENFEE